MPYAEVNGTKLFFFKRGSGLPLMVLHGGLGLDHTYLEETLKLLENDFEVIYYDMRGNGRSDMSSVDIFTYSDLVEDTDALREYLGYKKVFIMGHSAGGYIALLYSLKFQKNLSGLVLFDTVAQNPANY
jgi:proline iminopeptidase